MRISSLARMFGLTSKQLIQAFNLIAPDVQIKSASSRVEIDRDNWLFTLSIIQSAQSNDWLRA